MLKDELPFFWIGDPAHLPEGTPIEEITQPADAVSAMPRGLPVLPLDLGPSATPGKPNPAHASGVVAAIKTAVRLARDGQASSICTAPISKKALKDGTDFPYPGHTEFLAHLGGVDDVVMMLACDALRVVPATIHIPLSEVPASLTSCKLRRVIEITAQGLRDQFGINAPRIAIAGLNPHAGEGGVMGHEELEMIAPLIAELQTEGLTLTGPMPADTMFHARARAGYDAAIAMYHDQALIPIKTIAFDEGVNVTLGLPFIRTSPDHGTAFDIAGKNIAKPDSLIAALRMAHDMAKRTGRTG